MAEQLSYFEFTSRKRKPDPQLQPQPKVKVNGSSYQPRQDRPPLRVTASEVSEGRSTEVTTTRRQLRGGLET
jgi:hypothetical protein